MKMKPFHKLNVGRATTPTLLGSEYAANFAIVTAGKIHMLIPKFTNKDSQLSLAGKTSPPDRSSGKKVLRNVK
jgi:hypothetical protein